MPQDFQNTRYEYTTREMPTTHTVFHSSTDTEMEAQGWSRAWADVTTEGTFIVYRRNRQA